jgi:hypothetical protein
MCSCGEAEQDTADMQETSGIERREMVITNNTPGEALWMPYRRPPDS